MGGGTAGGSNGGGSAMGGGSAVGGGSGAMGGGHAGGGTGGGGTIIPPTPDGGWCQQPGAWVHDVDGGYHQVSGLAGHDLSYLTLPVGYCARWFGNVGNCRQLRFAPGGELFVASPTQGTTSGGPQGRAAIEVLPDDDHDGLADGITDWRSGLGSTQGLLFANNSFYYQDGTRIMKEPYANGDRAPTGTPVAVANITVYVSAGHWPKTLDIAEDGTIYVSNGGDEGETCDLSRPFHGGILALQADAGAMGARPVAKGLRNPIYVRCHHDGNNRCFADELARDYSTSAGGREKLLPIRDGDDWGYPCCASQNVPYSDVCLACGAGTATPGDSSTQCMTAMECSPLCTNTANEASGFLIGDTPFGLDFIDDQFPAPWDHHVFIAPHGAFGTWVGARVVGVPIDPATGLPPDGGAKEDFLNGWDDGLHDHGRPSDVTVAPDGRLFVSNDQTGDIIWVAPVKP